MDKKEIESLIQEKEKLFGELNRQRTIRIEKKSGVRHDADSLWNNTIWEDVLTGKITDKNKNAYVKSNLRDAEEELEFTENRIKSIKQKIEIIDDKLKYLGGSDD